MFRLTLDGSLVTHFRKVCGGPTIWARVYKWEDKTAIFLPGLKYEDSWIGEQRTPLAHGNNYLLEAVTPLMCTAPPPIVDDIWEEEVECIGNVILSNLYSIVGNAKTILETCDRFGVSCEVMKTLQALPQMAVPSIQGSVTRDLPLRPVSREHLPLKQPQPLQHHRSSHYLSKHPGPHELRREGRHLPVGEQAHAPRREHTSLQSYAPHVRPRPTFRDPSHRSPVQRLPKGEHAAANRPRYEQRRINPVPRAQGCLVVEE
jgi:hypothetical protein